MHFAVDDRIADRQHGHVPTAERRMVAPPERRWDALLARRQSPAPLLQSWAWGETRARVGWDVIRLFLPGSVPVTVLLRGRGPLRWAYVPRGPVRTTPDDLATLATWAQAQRLARLRVEPEAGPEVGERLRRMGFRRVHSVQPSHTRVIPLPSEDAMLAALHPRTRYNIRLALRRGVEVEEGRDARELARQVAQTARRHRVRLPGEAYFRTLLERLPWCRTYVARLRSEPLAAMLVARHDGRAYYLFSGTTRARADLKPVEAALWTAMLAAQRAGCADMDLWGMPDTADPAHPWHGFGQFKQGFGGETVEYAGTWDLALSPLRDRVMDVDERLRGAARRLLRPR